MISRNKDLDPGDVCRFCREQTTGYKVPKHVEFREERPKFRGGKFLRRELRDEQ